MKIAFLYLIFEFLFYLVFQFSTASLVFYGLKIEHQLDPHFSSIISSGAYSTRIFLLLDRIISLQVFTQFLLVWVFVKLDLLKHFFVVFALVFLSFGHFILLGFDIYVYQLSTLFLPGNYPNLMDKPGQYPFMYVGYVILASNFFALFAVTKLTKQSKKTGTDHG